MDDRTARALAALDRRFYERRAASFSRSRERPWPGWRRVLDAADRDPAARLDVLDAGCGNGRFGAYLATARPGPIAYLGLDASEPLLADARKRLATLESSGGRVEVSRADLHRADLHRADLLSDDLERLAAGRRFDLAALFGVFHHLPGYRRRRDLLARLGALLAPGGVLAVTVWRFHDAERLARKTLPWESFRPAPGEEIELGQLEAGDRLLSWRGAADPPRYCHLADDDEVETLLGELPLRCRCRFEADRGAGAGNLYLLLWAG